MNMKRISDDEKVYFGLGIRNADFIYFYFGFWQLKYLEYEIWLFEIFFSYEFYPNLIWTNKGIYSDYDFDYTKLWKNLMYF